VDMVDLNARKSAELNSLQRENRVEEPTRLKQDVLEKLQRPTTAPQPTHPTQPTEPLVLPPPVSKPE